MRSQQAVQKDTFNCRERVPEAGRKGPHCGEEDAWGEPTVGLPVLNLHVSVFCEFLTTKMTLYIISNF
jgi:hypothetical protein